MSHNSIRMTLVKRFEVMVRDNGFLKPPTDSWDNMILDQETYDTEGEAIAAILKTQRWDDYYILPRWDAMPDFGDT